MLCKDSKPLLNALADNELSPLAAWRMRHHLHHCSDCAQEYAAIQRIGNLATLWRDATDVPAPISLQTYIPDTATFGSKPKISNALQIGPVKIGRAAAAVAAIAALISIAFLQESSHQSYRHTNNGVAFAEVEAAMDKVQTLHSVIHGEWQGTIIKKQRPVNVAEKENSEMWAQSNPPAFAYVTAEAGTKYSTDAIRVPGPKIMYAQVDPYSRIIGDRNGVVKYGKGRPPVQVSSAPVNGAAIQKIMFINLLNNLKTGKATTVRDAKGRTLLCFLNIKKERIKKKYTADYTTRTTLLADPATRLPVQLKVEWYAESNSIHIRNSRHVLSTDFYYNQTPPADVFIPSMAAPTKKPKQRY